MIDRVLVRLLAGCALFGGVIAVELAAPDAEVATTASVAREPHPVAAPARVQGPRADELLTTILGRPLFSPTRQPPARPDQPTDAGLRARRGGFERSDRQHDAAAENRRQPDTPGAGSAAATASGSCATGRSRSAEADDFSCSGRDETSWAGEEARDRDANPARNAASETRFGAGGRGSRSTAAAAPTRSRTTAGMNRRGPGAWLFAGTVVTPSLILAACQPPRPRQC